MLCSVLFYSKHININEIHKRTHHVFHIIKNCISYENFSFLKTVAAKESSKAEDALFRLGYHCLHDDNNDEGEYEGEYEDEDEYEGEGEYEGENEDEELERDEL